ncbi:MAG: response regulator [Fibrobacterota bacterium]|nr:MAG: response regulator [Fibrobacterota bacterium]
MEEPARKFHERLWQLAKRGKSCLAGFGFAALVGLAAALFLGWSESSRQRERILLAVSDIAQQMEVADLRKLKGDSTDLESPEYLHMKAHLMAQRANVDQMRFVYLMRRDSDGRVRFLCDSEAPGSKDESPPGQEYPEISPVLSAAFDSPTPVLDGPYSDRWGTWISGVQPIRDPSDGSIIAVLGMDFSARDASRSILHAHLRGAALGLLLALGWLAMMFFRRRWRRALEEDPPRYPPTILLRLGPAVVVTFMGMATALGAFFEADRRATDQFEKSLRHEAGVRVDALRSGVLLARISMELLAHHVEAAQDAIHPEGWWLMANHMMDMEGAESVCWVPVVRDEDLPAFLSALSRLEKRPVELFEVVGGQRVRALAHEVHYPIAQAVPRERRLELLGWDLARQDGPRKAFEMARSEGRTFLTEPERSLDGTISVKLVSTAFTPAMPLRTRKEREDAIKGYAVAAFEMSRFLETHLRSTPSMGLDLFVEDLQAPPGLGRILEHRESDSNAVRDTSRRWDYSYVMDAGGRPWKITVIPTKAFLGRFLDRQHFWILPFGLFVSLLLAQMVSWLYGQRLRSEILVIHRTRDLRESNACTMAALAEVARQREAVHRSEERLVLTLEVVGEGLCEINLSKRTIQHNRVWSRIMGQPEDHELEHSLEEFFASLPPDEAALVAEGLEEARCEPGPFFLEFRIDAQGEGERWVQMKGRFLSEDQGGTETILATISDVTERRAAADRLLEMNRELGRSRMEAQRLAKDAQQASQSKSQFLANMSHEIRTPMNGVLGMIGLLLDTTLTDDQRRFAKIVRASAEALLSIINDILDFSKIESGKLELEKIPFDLRSTLDDVASTLALHSQERGLEFVIAADPDIPERIEGDPVRLRQILLNLAGNALKFTASGEVSVRVSIESRMGDELRLMFSVKDTGIGIPPAKQGELFKSFSQVDASTSRKFGGTGLGLAISKQLSEMMGGRIGLESEPGRGSTFWFSIATREMEATDSWDGKALLGGRHILVVDDSATNREILLWQLASWGAIVQTAASGQEALELLETSRTENVHFDAAILDMKMPNMNGEELARRIHAQEEFQALPMMLMTSLAPSEPVERLAQVGIRLRLSKPVRSSDLREALSVLLGGPKQVAPEPRAPVAASNVRRRILVAEDNAINQLVAQGILSSLGYDVHLVANGLLAVQALESEDFDLVLMDCQMPELNGFDATRMIRSADSRALNPKIPIIALTANALDDDRDLCLEAGMDDYLAKPFAPEALNAVLTRWFSDSPTQTT